ncbi:MAG: PAS-domain containing protein [Sphingomonadales bacterium]|nr:PAS-domain containing protein [Sphingomonadales bacterium]MDE2168369.1 PAS-domain containing protein [Sphingomonadales bacterium]
MHVGSAALFALAWIGLLFLVAGWADRRAQGFSRHLLPERQRRQRQFAYTMALGVFCSSWTIYGAVGSAARTGWDYLPIYGAPILVLLLAPGLLRRLSRAVAEEQAVTISDFIAARFGHDPVVARLVTLIALAGTVPYMALQLRSMGIAFSIVTGQAVAVPTMVAGAALLALFAMLFGARRFELTGRSEGLIYAVGLESLMKICAMLLVGALAVAMVMHAPPERVAAGWSQLAARFTMHTLSADTLAIALISAFAMLALPRQFYMALAEAHDIEDLPQARFGFAFYLTLMALSVFPIVLAGLTVLSPAMQSDYFVLWLPQVSGHRVIMAVELLGGISAAAAMVITDSTALATMVSNDLVFPTVVRAALVEGGAPPAGALGRRMLLVRRAAILALVASALTWALLVNPEDSLASIGLVAFAAMAQFTPHLIMAATGRRRDPLAARVSLALGFAFWFYTLALPPVLPPAWHTWLAQGPADPERLLGIGHTSVLVHGVVWSLGVNIAAYLLVAARKARGAPLPAAMRWQTQISDLGQLRDLVASFVGQDKAAAEFPEAQRGAPIDNRAAQRARALIGAVVGTSAARALVASALAGGRMTLAQVTRLLDERGHALGFSRQVLTATFENIEAGISVVDADLNLVAWNSRYEALFNYPPGMVYVGMPVVDLMRYNAMRGEMGEGDPEEMVARRLAYLRRGLPHSIERHRRDGTVIKISGGPMPGGGYVMSYTDITSEAMVRAELRQTLAQMESRVSARTAELSQANRQLARATADKTRFLAAASHDLLQPLHAARLFTAALSRDVDDKARVLVSRVDSAITAAEGLLRALLDISKLDAGGVTPHLEPLALTPFLGDLIDGFYPMAESKGLSLRSGPLGAGLDVVSDRGLLRSLLQNFLANALRYTVEGGVLLGVRRRMVDGVAWVRVDVVDTGVGIPADKMESIFSEFTRLGDVEVEGLGLGLALSERIARLLGARIEVASRLGHGSRFSLWLEAGGGTAEGQRFTPSECAPLPVEHRALTVLAIDDDARTVEATVALLTSMGHRAIGASGGGEALPHAHEADAALVDYRLDHGAAGSEDGLTVVQELRAIKPGLPAMLITAESGEWIRDLAASLGVEMHAKPAAPEAIEHFLARVATGLVGEIKPE